MDHDLQVPTPVERHELGRQIFPSVGAHLQSKGFRLSTGTIVDATLIAAPSSAKNAKGERDPEMKQSRTALLSANRCPSSRTSANVRFRRQRSSVG